MRLYPKLETNTEVCAPFCDINASREKLLFLVAEKRTYGELSLTIFLITTGVIIKVVTICGFIPRTKKIKDIFSVLLTQADAGGAVLRPHPSPCVISFVKNFSQVYVLP